MALHVPERLPCAPRPEPGEARSSWLRRVAAVNAVTFEEWLDALGDRTWTSGYSTIWLDDHLPAELTRAVAAWCRISAADVSALSLSAQYPLAPAWSRHHSGFLRTGPFSLRPTTSRRFCSRCFLDDHRRGRALHLRAVWALAWLSHCPRHRSWLLEFCIACGEVDPLCFDSLRARRICCRRCGAPLQAATVSVPMPRLTDTCRLQAALVDAAQGRPVPQEWVGPCTPTSFIQLVTDALTVLSQRADGLTSLIAEHLPDLAWPYPRSRSRSAEHWSDRSAGERLSLLSGAAALLRAPPTRDGADLLQCVVSLLPAPKLRRLRRRARRWPTRFRARLAQALRRV